VLTVVNRVGRGVRPGAPPFAFREGLSLVVFLAGLAWPGL